MRENRFMASIIILSVVLSTLLSACGTMQSSTTEDPEQRERLVIGLVPSENMLSLVEKYEPLVEYIGDQLDIETDLYISTDYGGIIEAMRSGHLDVAYIGAFPYVLAHREADAQPIAGVVVNGSRYYHSIIITRADSGINSLEDLRDNTFAFSDPGSGSGYLYPRATLLASGLTPETDFAEVTFAGGHDAVLLAVLNGHVDAGATFDAAPQILLEDETERAQIRVLATSEPILHGCFAVTPTLDESLIDELTDVLLHMHEDEAGSSALAQIGAEGFVETEDSDYDPTRNVAEILDLDLTEQH